MPPIQERIKPIIITRAMLFLPGMPIAVDLAASGLEDGSWVAREKISSADRAKPAWVRPLKFRAVELDPMTLKSSLSLVPHETMGAGRRFDLPMPDGTMARFLIVGTDLMHPDLAEKFPGIRTYCGRGITDPTATIRLDQTHAGFHAQVLSAGDAVWIDPYSRDDPVLHVSYYRKDHRRDIGDRYCQFDSKIHGLADSGGGGRKDGPSAHGDILRTYRLAIACTGEYARFHSEDEESATVTEAMAGIVTTMNRVVGIYERELAVRLQIVPGNDQLIFLDPDTDPYTNSDGEMMLDENQTTIDSILGTSTYDIGHVLSTGGGGIAWFGVCHFLFKAGGVTGSAAPVGDSFDVDFVAHEMGHQFHADHTFNSATERCIDYRVTGHAYEPGSGSTIMAYAGICGADDLQDHSDPFFHHESLHQVLSFITMGGGDACSANTPTGNSLPLVDAGPDHAIPGNTPFTLSAASASDANGDPVTYSWEQRNRGPARSLADPDNGSSPLFRAWPPNLNPTRVFPEMESLLNNKIVLGERLPTADRVMDFRLTVRDNRAGGGGTRYDDMWVMVDTSTGPFRVTSPTTALVLSPGSHEIAWDVAGTHGGLVSTAHVHILLSVDGGYTWPWKLAGPTPNDGSEMITIPDVSTSMARVRVEADDNIFFDVSDMDFVITAEVDFEPGGLNHVNDTAGNHSGSIDPGETIELALGVHNVGSQQATGISATLSTSEVGVSVLNETSVYPSIPAGEDMTNTTPFRIYVSGGYACGDYITMNLDVTSDQATRDLTFTFPLGGVTFRFDSITGADSPIPVHDIGITDIPINVSGVTGQIRDVDFSLDGTACNTFSGSTTVGFDHSWFSEVILSLVSPQGTQVTLLNSIGGSGGVRNICQARFDDDGPYPSIQSQINAPDPPFTGNWLPLEPLLRFDGEDANGTWMLRIEDTFQGNTGSVRAFSLTITPEICRVFNAVDNPAWQLME